MFSLICTGGVSALGLGEISVDSALNERLAASIPLLSPTRDQRDTVSVHVARIEDFQRAGIEWTEYMSTLRFRLVEERDGTRIVIDSDEPVREPYLNFVVEASWAGGRLLREYTVLLDPPKELNLLPTAKSAPIQPAAIPSSVSVTYAAPPAPQRIAPAVTPPAPAKPAAAQPAAGPARSSELLQYGPVHAREQPRAIAARLHPGPGVTQEQVELALYRANPDAFLRGRLDRMVPGAMLNIPPLDVIRAVSPESARAIILGMRAKLGLGGNAAGQAALRPHAPAHVAAAHPSAPPTPKIARVPAHPASAPATAPVTTASAPSSVTPAPVPKAATPAPAAPAFAPLPAAAVAAAPKPHAAPASPAPAAPQPHAFMGPRQWTTLLWMGVGGSVLIGLCALADLVRARRRNTQRPAPVMTPTLDVTPAPLPQKAPPTPEEIARREVDELTRDAEFCQHYGRLADGAQLIESAVARMPENKDLRFKLAEAYFAADMPDAFKRTAAALEGQLDEARQRKLAGMLDTLAARTSTPPAVNTPGSIAA